jgi:DNA-binding NarL/FixJ family response regulator
MKRISVLLADDHATVRKGLRTLLKTEGDIEVVGEAKNGRQAVRLTQKLHQAVVLMDIAMPLLNGLEATRIILDTLPRTKVIILSAHDDDAYVEQAKHLGAAGYLLKQSSTGLLGQAVRVAPKGADGVQSLHCQAPPRPAAKVHNYKQQQEAGQTKARSRSGPSPRSRRAANQRPHEQGSLPNRCLGDASFDGLPAQAECEYDHRRPTCWWAGVTI